MDSTLQPATTPDSNDLAIQPEPESTEDLSHLPPDRQSGFSVTTDTAAAVPPLNAIEAAGSPGPMAIQPEAEDLQALPAMAAADGSSLQEFTSVGPSTSAESSENLTGRPVRRPGSAIVPWDNPQLEFTENVRKGNYVDAVATVVSKLCHLEIVTIVEDEDDPRSYVGQTHNQGQPGHRMITSMDLVGGDITTILGKRFVESSDYKPLQELHNRQVNEGLTIMKNNLQNLVSAIKALRDLAGEP